MPGADSTQHYITVSLQQADRIPGSYPNQDVGYDLFLFICQKAVYTCHAYTDMYLTYTPDSGMTSDLTRFSDLLVIE